jgi:hypothetical protein
MPAKLLSDKELVLALQIQLGLPPLGFRDPHLTRCNKCQADLTLQANRYHMISGSCPGIRGTTITHRHDGIVATMAEIARLAGAPTVDVEPGHLASNWSHRRPDIFIIFNNNQFLIDVTVTHATDTFLASHRGCHANLIAADAMKMKHYQEMADRIGAQVVPMAFDISGTLSRPGTLFLNELAAYAEESSNGATSANTFLLSAKYQLSTAVARGNARAHEQGLISSISFPLESATSFLQSLPSLTPD